MSKSPIPLWSYADEYTELRDRILLACDRTFLSGRLVLGEEGKSFEAALAQSIGVKGCVGVNNGTDAIFIALSALDVKHGDEVITVSNTAVPTVSAITTLGADPVFVDVGNDCLMDVNLVESAITDRTRAIVPVHLFGQMVDMDPLMEIARRHQLVVVEDCAQAQGSTYRGRFAGSIGHAGTFSFYPTKILGCYGDGGAIVSNNAAVVDAARMLRFYGMEKAYYAERHGYNSRLDEVQAAILSLKLPELEERISQRRTIAALYDKAFIGSKVKPVSENAYGRHVYHLYVIEVDDRESVMQGLVKEGIGTGICYRWPIHTMRGYAHLGYGPDDFPVTLHKAGRVMNLPIYPALGLDAVDRVAETVLHLVN